MSIRLQMRRVVPNTTPTQQQINSNSPISTLRVELFLLMMHFLGPREACRAAAVNRQWQILANDPILWKHYNKRDFGHKTSKIDALDWKQTYRQIYSGRGYLCSKPILTWERTMHVVALHFPFSAATYSPAHERIDSECRLNMYSKNMHVKTSSAFVRTENQPYSPSISAGSEIVSFGNQGMDLCCMTTNGNHFSTPTHASVKATAICGKTIFAAHADRTVSCYTIQSESEESPLLLIQQFRVIPTNEHTVIKKLAADERYLVLADQLNACVWEWLKPEQDPFTLPLPSAGSDIDATLIAIALKGSVLAIANFSSVIIYDLETQKPISEFSAPQHPIQHMILSTSTLVYITERGVFGYSIYGKFSYPLYESEKKLCHGVVAFNEEEILHFASSTTTTNLQCLRRV